MDDALSHGGRDEHMHKVISYSPPLNHLRFSNELGSFRPFQSLDQPLFLQIAGLFERLKIEVAPQDGSHLQHFLCKVWQFMQASPDCGMHSLRDFHLCLSQPVPSSILVGKLPSLNQCFTNLFDKKWVALRLAIDAIQKIRCDLFSEHGGKQIMGFITTQPF